jgi:hypothetical protein
VDVLDRLRALDERHVWAADVTAPQRLTPGLALVTGLLAVCVYAGWALHWGWPRALLSVLGLVAGVWTVGRFWFGAPRR